MPDPALDKDRHIGRTTANIYQHNPPILVFGTQHRFTRSEGLEYKLIDPDTRLLYAPDQVLDGHDLTRHDVRLNLETKATHADWVTNALMAVEDVGSWDDMDNLTLGGNRNRLCRLNGTGDITARNLLIRTLHCYNATAVERRDVPPTHPHKSCPDSIPCESLSLLDARLNRTDRVVNVYDDTFVQALTRSYTNTQNVKTPTITQLGNNSTDFGCSNIDANDRSLHRAVSHSSAINVAARAAKAGRRAGMPQKTCLTILREVWRAEPSTTPPNQTLVPPDGHAGAANMEACPTD